MITTEDIELIDKFINEELEPLELRKFQGRVRDDLQFSLEVRNQITAVKGVRAFAALRFMDDLKKQMPALKAGGYNTYIPSIDLTKVLLRIFVPAIILGLSYVIFSIVQEDRPSNVLPVKEAPSEEILPDKTPEPGESDSNMDMMRLKTSELQVADTKINVEDPSTFSIVLKSRQGDTYTYLLEYDGKSQTITSDQDNLVELLTKQMDGQKGR